MSITKRMIQGVFYALVLLLLVARALSAGINHDENQFIASAQLLSGAHLLPYVDYPYTHMPYAIPLYALAEMLSPYDYLAARLLNVLAWFGCAILLVAIVRLVGHRLFDQSASAPSWPALLGEFALVLVFLFQPLSRATMGFALNHSFATFFALLAWWLLVRGFTGPLPRTTEAFWCGICASLAAWTRFNYASLIVVLVVLWLLHVLLFARARWLRLLSTFSGGVLIAALPALTLLALAPGPFYYGNLVYIRLNTLYYRGLRYEQAMDLVAKFSDFLASIDHSPIDAVVYGLALFGSIFFLIRFLSRRSLPDLLGLSAAAFAVTMYATAFSPTPTQSQYFIAPLPFMLILLALLGWMLYRRRPQAYVAVVALVVLALVVSPGEPSPLADLTNLRRPATWYPLQVHAFAESLSTEYHVPAGKVLAILSMLPAEAGYGIYPFTATGPFSWRTSVLLSPQRRIQYGVTSPAELPGLLDADPPVAILTGLEPPWAAFQAGDPRSLERPLDDYAQRHGYTRVSIQVAFLAYPVSLWVRQP